MILHTVVNTVVNTVVFCTTVFALLISYYTSTNTKRRNETLLSCFVTSICPKNLGETILSCVPELMLTLFRVFPRLQYKVTGRSGATVRSGEPLDSPIQCTLTPGTIVEVTEVRGRLVFNMHFFFCRRAVLCEEVFTIMPLF